MTRVLILAAALATILADDVATADRLSWASPIQIDAIEMPSIQANESAPTLSISELFNRRVQGNGDVIIGNVCDVLLSPLTGEIVGLVVGVGAFLGTGDKSVAISIGEIERSPQGGRNSLVIHATRKYLQTAEAVRFDGATSAWVKIESPAM